MQSATTGPAARRIANRDALFRNAPKIDPVCVLLCSHPLETVRDCFTGNDDDKSVFSLLIAWQARCKIR
ncbi:exodeoxyribonuclease V subunit gamma [Anopheles sinensis]|uniref:Exodeoxyribonuclease V subunit gamma n=1 Tax=Anopheles sinensis TaxID=74873 RepID=A0A084W8G1_ANOSI|nr:exodeoxyribonuclease V subunit gamma [Anopheles sinensis]